MSLGQIPESNVRITTICDVYLRVLLYYAVQAIALAILVLQFEVQSESQNNHESCESTANGAAANIEWSAGKVSNRRKYSTTIDSPIRRWKECAADERRTSTLR